MKPSFYNYYISLMDEINLFFNFYTLSLIVLDSSESVLARHILEETGRSLENEHALELFKIFVDKGFIIDDQVEELEVLRTFYSSSRTQRKDVTLTIAPSLACNFNCIYCYETKNNMKMSRKTQQALIRFVEEKVQRKGKLSVTWFGGEPLLQMDIIDSLSNAFIDICDKRHAKYSARIITNGFLFNSKNVEKLLNLNVESAQVTLDGPASIQDKRRPLKTAGKTFQTVFDNLKESSEKIKISLRMNTDNNNRDHILDMIDILVQEGLEKKVGFYLGQTYPYTDVCGDVAGWCLTDEDFSLLGLETQMEMIDRGFTSSFGMPASKNIGCLAESESSYVMTPSGGIVRCWNEVSNQEAEVAHLLNPCTDRMKKNINRWRCHNPFEMECAECLLLPVCMGGCPYIFERTGKLDCHSWKYHTKESLTFYYYLKKIRQEGEILQQFQKAVESLKELKKARESFGREK